MTELINNQQSQQFLEISPVFVDYNESSSFPFGFPFEDLSFSKINQMSNANFINQEDPKEKEILENIKEKENIYENEINKEPNEPIEPEEKSESQNFNIFQALNELPLPKFEMEKPKEKDLSENIEITKKSTGANTNTNKININKLIFGVKGEKKIEPRIDYAIKNIKVHISKFMNKYGNELIKECNFQNRLKKVKLFLPSYNYFTGNSNEKDNYVFLNFTVEQILTYPDKIEKNSKKNNRLQRQNKEIIKDIKDHIEEKYPDEKPQKCQEMLNFFSMTYEELISLFYKSKLFKDYSSSTKTQKLDEQFIKSKGFSLMENNGFIRLIKNYYKKNK